MHSGVIRDTERTRIKRERQEDFDLQALLKKEYLKGQTVTDTSAQGDHRSELEKDK